MMNEAAGAVAKAEAEVLAAKVEVLKAALARLTLEAMHYANTGVGKQFLVAAVENAHKAYEAAL